MNTDWIKIRGVNIRKISDTVEENAEHRQLTSTISYTAASKLIIISTLIQGMMNIPRNTRCDVYLSKDKTKLKVTIDPKGDWSLNRGGVTPRLLGNALKNLKIEEGQYSATVEDNAVIIDLTNRVKDKMVKRKPKRREEETVDSI